MKHALTHRFHNTCCNACISALTLANSVDTCYVQRKRIKLLLCVFVSRIIIYSVKCGKLTHLEFYLSFMKTICCIQWNIIIIENATETNVACERVKSYYCRTINGEKWLLCSEIDVDAGFIKTYVGACIVICLNVCRVLKGNSSLK